MRGNNERERERDITIHDFHPISILPFPHVDLQGGTKPLISWVLEIPTKTYLIYT